MCVRSAQVFPRSLRQISTKWSVPDTYNPVEKPFSAEQLSPSIPVCVALPLQPSDGKTSAPRQIQLICSFDYALDSNRPAYLVRISTDGTRQVCIRSYCTIARMHPDD